MILAPTVPPSRRVRALVVWLSLGIATAISVLALGPVPEGPGLPTSDKTQHMIAFAALVFPTALAMPRALLRVCALALAYGALIEVIQPQVGRQGEVMDWLADLAGVGLGALAGWLAGTLLRSWRT